MEVRFIISLLKTSSRKTYLFQAIPEKLCYPFNSQTPPLTLKHRKRKFLTVFLKLNLGRNIVGQWSIPLKGRLDLVFRVLT